MKLLHILTFTTSILISLTTISQNVKDSTITKTSYGIRIGADILKPLVSVLENNGSSFEIIGDFRVYKNFYSAVELGFQEKTTNEDYLNFSTKGSYIKVGGNYNLYENWKGMHNEIYIGVRYAYSTFSQTLHNYTPNVKGTYFIPITIEDGQEFTNLNAQWIELIFGLKVETLKNLYLGGSISFNNMISTKEPTNFKNLQVPGFNKVNLNSAGVGFNYSISYHIPIFKGIN